MKSEEYMAARANLAQAADNLEKLRDAGEQTQGCGPKPWGELSIEEKIERTREQIKVQQRYQEHISQELSDVRALCDRLQRQMVEHTHNQVGRAVQPIVDSHVGSIRLHDGGQCTRAEDPSKIYF